MTNTVDGPQPVDSWQGSVSWIEKDRSVFISDLYYPNEEIAVDYVEEVEIAIDQLPEEQRQKLRNFLSFTCTVELDSEGINGIKEVRDVTFLPPKIITKEAVEAALNEFAFLSELPE